MYKDHDYILTSSGELYHYGVKGMKWGVRRTSTELPIGQNYTTPSGGGGGEPEEEDEEKENENELDVMDAAKKADRYIETAKVWVDSRLHTRVADVLTGKAQPMSWEDAKRWVDHTHRYADEYSR